MKNLNYKPLKNILYLFLCFILCFGFFNLRLNTNSSYAEEKITIDSSKFIYNPSYSSFYEEKLYFIDNYESSCYFKIFSIESSQNSYALSSEKLEFDIVDAFAINNYFFVLTNENIMYADLSKNEISFAIFNEESFENNSYMAIFVYNINDEYIITLTPAKDSQANILVFIYTPLNQTILHREINNSKLKDGSLNVSILATIKIKNNEYCFIYFEENSISYQTSSTLLFETIIPITILPTPLLTDLYQNENTQIVSVDNITLTTDFDINDYFLITYQEPSDNGNNTYSLFYSYDFETENAAKFNLTSLSSSITQIDSLSPYIQTNGNYIIYPEFNNGPEIAYKSISNLTFIGSSIKNPNPTIEDFNHSEYQVKSTNEPTYLLKNPWDTSSDIQIDDQIDVLIVGLPLINDIEIDNIYYCLYTSKNADLTYKNNYGYIKADALSNKPEITLTDLNLANIVKVFPNTSLYSLPSKASEIKLETDGKFSVEIIDVMNNYKTDSIEWIKVRIGNTSGYIDRNKIDYSNNKVNFITTNATITQDNTYVYSEANNQSSLIYSSPLKKGKTVYIDGIRDTKTGYTKIKFNDDFGNEFEGFVKTENLKSDNWSQLQIIGTILIAVNSGILILILVFKNKKLGKSKKYQPDHTDDEILN